MKKQFTTVTPFSKALAMILFIVLPFVGFYLGIQYQKRVAYLSSKNNQQPNTQMQSASIYKGTLPCADCTGIETTLILYSDNTYKEVYIYRDRNQQFIEKGTWKKIRGIPADPKAIVYQLTKTDGGNHVTFYLVRDNQLIGLDSYKQEDPELHAVLTRQ